VLYVVFIYNIFVSTCCIVRVDVQLQCKIVRVLNLWQKHGVYAASVVQPLLDMAGDSLDDSFGSPGNQLNMCICLSWCELTREIKFVPDIFSPHGIAMPKGLYFTAVFLLLSFFDA